MEMKLTIRKDKTETVYKKDTRTITWKTFTKIVDVFDVKNLLTALPQVLQSLGKLKSGQIEETVKSGELEELIPLLNVITSICLNSMDKVTGILLEIFNEFDLTEEDINNCDFDEIITCLIVLITNVGQVLGLLKKTKK